MGAPLRVLHRGLARAHRAALRLERLIAEVAVSLSPHGLARAANEAYYGASSAYTRPEAQRAGLYPFEERALSAWFPQPPARLFLPGAGGGRGVLALLDRGYEVDALEPSPVLVDAIRLALIARGAGVRAGEVSVRRATLEEWAEVPVGHYDGVFTGWGMWSHILRREDRLAALRAFRAVCPRGPVLLSFWRRERVFDPEERFAAADSEEERSPLERRAQAFTRGFLRRRLLRLPPVEPGTVWRAGLFVHCVSEAELSEEAAVAGYRLEYYERDGSRYPNAVLVPG